MPRELKYARQPIQGEPVRVYKNLNNGRWSLQARIAGKSWQVITHLDAVSLRNPKPVISLTKLAQIRREQRKTVCAYIEGTYSQDLLDACTEVHYNPYRAKDFTYTDGAIFKGASVATFSPNCGHFLTD